MKLDRNTAKAFRYPTKVIQFGEGNFLRAFVDWIIWKTNQKTDFNAGVVVVQPIEKGMCDVLENQNCKYTHISRGLLNGEEIIAPVNVADIIKITSQGISTIQITPNKITINYSIWCIDYLGCIIRNITIVA